MVTTAGYPFAGGGDWNMPPDTPGLEQWAEGIKSFIVAPQTDTFIAGGGKIVDYFIFSQAFDGFVGSAWTGTHYSTTPHRPAFVKVRGVNKDSKVLVRQK